MSCSSKGNKHSKHFFLSSRIPYWQTRNSSYTCCNLSHFKVLFTPKPNLFPNLRSFTWQRHTADSQYLIKTLQQISIPSMYISMTRFKHVSMLSFLKLCKALHTIQYQDFGRLSSCATNTKFFYTCINYEKHTKFAKYTNIRGYTRYIFLTQPKTIQSIFHVASLLSNTFEKEN